MLRDPFNGPRRPNIFGKVLTMMVGFPRSGKTTWIQMRPRTAIVVSADEMRKAVYGQRFFGNGEPLAWAIREIHLRLLLAQGVNIIIDECNTKPERREPIIKLAKEYGYRVEAMCIGTDAETCIQRAKDENDLDIIPSIERMRDQYVMPDYSEGFDCIGASNTLIFKAEKDHPKE